VGGEHESVYDRPADQTIPRTRKEKKNHIAKHISPRHNIETAAVSSLQHARPGTKGLGFTAAWR
jgi:hypothetical protein